MSIPVSSISLARNSVTMPCIHYRRLSVVISMGAPSMWLPCKRVGCWGVEEEMPVHQCTTLVRVCFVIVCQRCADVDLCDAICKVTLLVVAASEDRLRRKQVPFVSPVDMNNKV
ncbi:hypothetical protein AALO_G00102140 [Alosa alosa]|uniref:Uncharacterized protein n=1 Tax=Alosa alosa TaxID=278164 RepID=A0AAV6GY48_9TELE|nr:hypothetical protein AALO_G00102140 [Alosa alosa]